MKFVQLGTQIKTQCEKKKICKNTQKVHYKHVARGRTKAAPTQHATGGRKSFTDLYKGGNYYIPKTAPNSPRDRPDVC